MANNWIKSQDRVWSRRYAMTIRRSLDQDVFPKIGMLSIGAITAPMIVEVLRAIERPGAVETAHRSRQRIGEVFARAIGLGVVQSDPSIHAGRALTKVKKSKQPAVRTIAAAVDVLREVVEQPSQPLTKLASRLLALTAVRSSVLRLATAPEFEGLDGPMPLWRIPAARMKLTVERKEDVAFEFIVPLSRQAVETVRLAVEFSGKSPLIFRSVRHPRKPISDSTLSKAYREAGFSVCMSHTVGDRPSRPS